MKNDIAFNLHNTNIMVEFLIIGDDFNPEEITLLFALHPDKKYKKGDIHHKNIKKDYSYWAINSGYIETLDLREPFSLISDIIMSRIIILNHLKEKYNLENRIDVVVNIENSQSPFLHLDKEMLNFMMRINAEIDFDLYVI